MAVDSCEYLIAAGLGAAMGAGGCNGVDDVSKRIQVLACRRFVWGGGITIRAGSQ